MISTDMLLAFIKVAETLNVSKSALFLNVGKSVVSKRVAQLESQLGVTLFSRSTRHIALTSAGESYLEHAKKAVAELSAGEERLRALRSEITGKIRATAPVSWGQRILAKKIPEFLRMHPGVDLELVLSDRMMDIAFERLDIAFRWSTAIHDQHDLVVKSIASIEWQIVASPQYLSMFGEPLLPGDLENHACLFYWREPSDDWWFLTHGTEQVKVKTQGRYHVDNPEAVLEACRQGLGVALLPSYLCAKDVEGGQLVRLLSNWEPQTRFGRLIAAAAPPERMRILRNQLFLEFVRESSDLE